MRNGTENERDMEESPEVKGDGGWGGVRGGGRGCDKARCLYSV